MSKAREASSSKTATSVLESGTDAVEMSPPRAQNPKTLSVQTRVLFALAIAVGLSALFWPQGDGTFDAPGGFLLDARGQPAPLGPRMAPVTLVHFWATWCPPCMTEVPSLNRLSDDFARDHGTFRLVTIAVADNVDTVEGFLGDRAQQVLYDQQWEVAHRYGTRKLPETYLVVDGDVVETFIGAQNWDDPKIRKILEDAIAAATAG